ncbi:MAG: ADP-dependent glucokinase/phosphofructokinase [Propionicimonas sp.]
MSQIVLGLNGGTIDYLAPWDGERFNAVVAGHAIGLGELDEPGPDLIATPRQAIVRLLRAMRDGRGGEWHVENAAVVDYLLAAFPGEYVVGGTALRAAEVLDEAGVACLVHLTSSNDIVRAALPGRVSVLEPAAGDSLEPHFVLQYPGDFTARLADGEFRTPGRNRLILLRDLARARMELSPELPGAIARASLLLLSGFNALRDPAVLADRLQALRRMRDAAFVVYENGGFHSHQMQLAAWTAVPEIADLASFNDEEAEAILGQPFVGVPVEQTYSRLVELRRRTTVRLLLVHSREWAVLLGEGAAGFGAELQAAVETATRVASDRRLSVADLRNRPFSVAGTELARRFGSSDVDAAVSPVREIGADAVRTIGLGDAFIGGFIASYARRLSPVGQQRAG